MTITAVLLGLSSVVIWAAVKVSLWILLALVASVPLAATCAISGVLVLFAARRQWEGARHVGMTSENGWRTYGEGA